MGWREEGGSAAGQCLLECKEWDACLAMLGDDESAAPVPMDTDDAPPVFPPLPPIVLCYF